MRARLKTIGITAAAALLAGPALADTKAGVDAWERGDYGRAVTEWRTAANGGDADAAFNLGQAYKLGRGVPVDTRQAESWYQQAAAKGHVQAQDNYGLALFQNGRPRDAIPYLEKSIARGEPRAQYILGTMLFNGTDIKRDWVRAYALTARASQSGLPQAAQAMTQMDAYVTAADRQQGLALAARMDAGQGSAPPAELAGRGGSQGMRGVDLPPSLAGRSAAGLPPAPTYNIPEGQVPPVYVPPAERARNAARAAAPPPPRAPAVAAERRPIPAPPATTSGRWRVQLGAFGDPGNARKLWGQVGSRFAGRSVDYLKSGTLTRVLVGPFTSRADAQAACGSVRPCVPVGP